VLHPVRRRHSLTNVTGDEDEDGSMDDDSSSGDDDDDESEDGSDSDDGGGLGLPVGRGSKQPSVIIEDITDQEVRCV
jgi:hypothetical protein